MGDVIAGIVRRMTVKLQPADVLVVRGGGFFGSLIRFGSGLAGKPNLDGHVCMFSHYDAIGIPWGIEGRPGGVGVVDMRPYLADPYMLNNCGQPNRNGAGRLLAARDMQAAEGTPYDWAAILGDALNDVSPVNLCDKLWNVNGPQGVKPGAVVCSSFAAYVYAKRNWDHPDLNDERYCQPDDWAEFIISHGYNVKLT